MARFSRARQALCCVFGFFILSCNDSPPQIQNARFRAVFDYKSLTEPPEMSVMLFVQPDTDASLVSKIILTHAQSEYIWEISEPVILKDAQFSWAGSEHIVNVPPVFPQGNYYVRYIDAAERESGMALTLVYPPQLAASTAANALENVPMSSVRQVALYDSEEHLIYFGERGRHWATGRNVISDYPAARFYRDCYVSQAAVLLMPLEALEQ
jgi:hypothetical protein